MFFKLRGVALVSLLLLPVLLPAQEFRATITGRVTDSSGAVVASAKVHAVNQGTNEAANTVSDSSGIYTLPLLQPGTYTVNASANGFKSYVRANVVLNTGDQVGIDIQMEVGAVEQTVTVTAETPILDTQSATVGFVVNNTDVTELPLNGRNPYMLSSLSPSVNYNGSQQFQRPFDNGAIANWSINGGLQNMNEFLLDGAPNNAQAGGNNLAWVIPVDATSEFKIQTTTYDAEYGKTAGGIVNITTKAGTNKFHGTGYEFMRRTPLDAIPPADAAVGSTSGVPVDYLNQYGFSLGGPAKVPKISELFHGKTFFFVNYERYYQDNPQAEQYSMPTLQEMGLAPGETDVYDFSGLNNPLTDGGTPITIYNPFTTAVNAFTPGAVISSNGQSVTRSPLLIANPFFGGTCPSTPSGIPTGTFSCNTTSPTIQGIPSNLINPIALMIAGYLPAPNRNGVTAVGATRYGTSDYALSASANPFLGNGEDHFYNFISRVDQDFGANDKVFFRFGADDRHQQNIGTPLTGVGTTGQNPLIRANYATAADWTHTISPTLITDLRLSLSQYVEATDSTANASVTPAVLGFSPSVVSQIHYPKAFGIYAITNYQNLGKDVASTNYTNTFAVAAKMIKVSGAHTYKFGVDLRWIQENYVNVGNNFDLGFADTWTQCVFPVSGNCAGGGAAANQGDGLASLLMGLPTSFESDNLIRPAYLTRYYAGYFQDDWRVNSRLSVNLGLRYDVHPPVSEGHNALTDGFASNQVNPINGAVQAAVAAFNPAGVPGQYTAANYTAFKAAFPNGLPPIMGGLNYVGSSGKSDVMTDWTGIQPRIGIAYQVSQKLVIRGGWARYMLNPTNDWYQNPPPGYNQNTSFGTTTGLQNSAFTAGLVPFGSPCTASTPTGCGGNLLTNPFAVFGTGGIPLPTGNALLSETQLGNSVNFFNPRFHLAWVGEFSAGIQYSLPFRSRLEITYVGNRGYKLEANNTYNVIPLSLRQKCDPLEVLALNAGSAAPLPPSGGPPSICNTVVPNPFFNLPQFAGSGLNTSTTTVGQLSVPFPEFATSGVESGLNLGKMWYNGLVALYTVHAGTDLTLNASYTFSNTVEMGGYPTSSAGSNENSDAGEAFTDAQRGILERSPASWDIPNELKISGVYQLPFGKGKRFAGNAGRLLTGLIGGWEYNTNMQYQSGRPWGLPANVEFFPNGMNGSASAALPVDWKGGPNVLQGVRPCVGAMSATGVITLESYSAAYAGCTTANLNFLSIPTSIFAPISGANLRTTVIHTQPAFTADMSLAKTISITERIRFQFRAEAFNAFNTPWLAATQFNSTISSSSFGTITKSTSQNGAAYPNREIQLGFKVIF